MKTAEECYQEIIKLPLLCHYERDAKKAAAVFIHSVQLDALKAGMTKAAEIVSAKRISERTDVGYLITQDIKRAILDARDNLKELP